MELPKIPSVVGCKDGLQEGGRHSDVSTGWVEACGATWCSWKQVMMKHGESSKVIDR